MVQDPTRVRTLCWTSGEGCAGEDMQHQFLAAAAVPLDPLHPRACTWAPVIDRWGGLGALPNTGFFFSISVLPPVPLSYPSVLLHLPHFFLLSLCPAPCPYCFFLHLYPAAHCYFLFLHPFVLICIPLSPPRSIPLTCSLYLFSPVCISHFLSCFFSLPPSVLLPIFLSLSLSLCPVHSHYFIYIPCPSFH